MREDVLEMDLMHARELFMGSRRDRIAYPCQPRKELRAAPTYVYSHKRRRLSFIAHARADRSVLVRKPAKSDQAFLEKEAGFFSHAYLIRVRRVSPSAIRARCSCLRTRPTANYAASGHSTDVEYPLVPLFSCSHLELTRGEINLPRNTTQLSEHHRHCPTPI